MVTWYVALLAGLALLMLLEQLAKVINRLYWIKRINRARREYIDDYTAKDGTCLLCAEPEPHVCKARI